MMRYINKSQLRNCREISLTSKDWVYNEWMKIVLLYAYKTWPLRVNNVRRLFTFNHCRLRRIPDIRWQQSVSKSDIR